MAVSSVVIVDSRHGKSHIQSYFRYLDKLVLSLILVNSFPYLRKLLLFDLDCNRSTIGTGLYFCVKALKTNID